MCVCGGGGGGGGGGWGGGGVDVHCILVSVCERRRPSLSFRSLTLSCLDTGTHLLLG